jgi:hypothetical protein
MNIQDPRRASQIEQLASIRDGVRQSDLMIALQAYGDTHTGKLALVHDLKAALVAQFGPVAGRTIAEMAGE